MFILIPVGVFQVSDYKSTQTIHGDFLFDLFIISLLYCYSYLLKLQKEFKLSTNIALR